MGSDPKATEVRVSENDWVVAGRIVGMGAMTAVVVEGGRRTGMRTSGARVSIADFPPRFRSVLVVGEDIVIGLHSGERDVLNIGDTVTVRISLGCLDAVRHNLEAREALKRLGLGDIPFGDGDAIQTHAFIAEAATPEIQAARVASIRKGRLPREPLDATTP